VLPLTDKEKTYGQYFTPFPIAEFMVQEISKSKNARILEPSSGKGVFLDALWENGFRNVTAYEIDPEVPGETCIKPVIGDFLKTDARIEYDVIIGNPPFVRWKNIPKEIKETFIENPYWEDKVNGLSDLLYPFIYLSVEKLKDEGELLFITPIFWTQTLHASRLRTALSYSGGLEWLLTFDEIRVFKGASSSIAIFKFCKSRKKRPVKIIHVTGKHELKADILERTKIMLRRLDNERHIVDRDIEAYLQPQFDNGQPWKPIPPDAYPLVHQIENGCKTEWPLVKIHSKKHLMNYHLSDMLDKDDIEVSGIQAKELESVQFAGKKYFIPKTDRLSDKERGTFSRYIRLGDIVDIGNGLVSGLDQAFQVKEPEKFGSEKEKFLWVIKAKDLRQFYHLKETPYIFVNDIPNEGDLKANYPRIFDHLIAYSTILKARYDYAKDIPWWHWVFLRNWNLIHDNSEKILVPCKERIDSKGFVRFAYVNGPFHATQDVTVIVKKREFKEDTRYIVSLLNSKVLFLWNKYNGLMRGGVLEFSEKPLTRIPIRLIDWDNPSEIKDHERIVSIAKRIIAEKECGSYTDEIEAIVRRLYGI
jgi:adenine-specific DNA-methyltransferase